MNPVLVHIGPFSLTWYGIFIVGGAMLAAYFGGRLRRDAGENPDHVWNILAWSLLAGIIGARLYHVFSSPVDGPGWPYYRTHPLDIINFWSGGFHGLGIYGGLAGGGLAIVVYCRVNKLSILRYLDFIAPNVLLAQAVGRMGNFVNQELYGPATDLPWAFHINPHFPCQAPPNVAEGIQACAEANLTQETLAWYASHGFHPTFFYEALWNLSMWALLMWLIWQFGRRLRVGDAVLLYFIAYPLGRFWVEMFRPDAWMMGGMATAQWIAIGLAALSAVIMAARHVGWSWRDHPEKSLVALSRHRHR